METSHTLSPQTVRHAIFSVFRGTPSSEIATRYGVSDDEIKSWITNYIAAHEYIDYDKVLEEHRKANFTAMVRIIAFMALIGAILYAAFYLAARPDTINQALGYKPYDETSEAIELLDTIFSDLTPLRRDIGDIERQGRDFIDSVGGILDINRNANMSIENIEEPAENQTEEPAENQTTGSRNTDSDDQISNVASINFSPAAFNADIIKQILSDVRANPFISGPGNSGWVIDVEITNNQGDIIAPTQLTTTPEASIPPSGSPPLVATVSLVIRFDSVGNFRGRDRDFVLSNLSVPTPFQTTVDFIQFFENFRRNDPIDDFDFDFDAAVQKNISDLDEDKLVDIFGRLQEELKKYGQRIRVELIDLQNTEADFEKRIVLTTNRLSSDKVLYAAVLLQRFTLVVLMIASLVYILRAIASDISLMRSLTLSKMSFIYAHESGVANQFAEIFGTLSIIERSLSDKGSREETHATFAEKIAEKVVDKSDKIIEAVKKKG